MTRFAGTVRNGRPDCVFCDPARLPDVVEYPSTGVAGEPVMVFTPLDLATPGHLLVVPVRHVEDAWEDPEVTGRVMAAAAAVGARSGLPANLITSVGAEATQTVRHLHVHVVPRRPGDRLALPWTGSRDRDAVLGLADEWCTAACIQDGAPCSWHRVAVDCAAEVRGLFGA